MFTAKTVAAKVEFFRVFAQLFMMRVSAYRPPLAYSTPWLVICLEVSMSNLPDPRAVYIALVFIWW
jgi:hypothetical protein